jgi:hypothetical protein
LDRSQPLLPMSSGQVERHTHDYVRSHLTGIELHPEVAIVEIRQVWSVSHQPTADRRASQEHRPCRGRCLANRFPLPGVRTR